MKVKSLVDVARALIASAKSRSGNSEGNEDGGDTQEGLKEVASLLSSVVNFNWKPLKFNTAPIGDFYRVKSKVLGHGVNGKVKQCVNKAGQKFALKVDKRNENGVFHYFYLVCLPKTIKSSADLW